MVFSSKSAALDGISTNFSSNSISFEIRYGFSDCLYLNKPNDFLNRDDMCYSTNLFQKIYKP